MWQVSVTILLRPSELLPIRIQGGRWELMSDTLQVLHLLGTQLLLRAK